MAQLEHATSHTARIYIRQANRARGAEEAQVKVDALLRRRAGRTRSRRLLWEKTLHPYCQPVPSLTFTQPTVTLDLSLSEFPSDAR